MRERDYLWDNIKALLIFLVVAGHCLEFCGFTLSAARAIDYFIYSFHMPAFVFVSGFWAKRYCMGGKVRAEKAATLFAYYAVFQLLFIALRLILNINTSALSILRPCRGLWYLLAIFIYYLITPVIEKLPAYLTLPVFIILSALIGRDSSAGNYLGALRIVVFAPYFFMGYYFSADTLKKARSLKLPVRVLSGLACAAASASIWVIQRNTFSRYLFFGNKNYSKLGVSNLTGSVLRLECIVIALLMIAALLLLMPSKKLFFSVTGQRSLQIYALHMLLVILLFDTGLIDFCIDTYPRFALITGAASAVTAVLSLGVFSYPFKWIQSGVQSLYKLKK